MSSIHERNQRILQLRKEVLSRTEVARTFQLSPSRVYLLEKQDAAEKAMAERRTRLRHEMLAADDPDRYWPVNDLLDALHLIVVTRKRLIDHFAEEGKQEISLRELMDMCVSVPVEGTDYTLRPLLRVYGVGKKGYWDVVNGLTGVDWGRRCNEEWRRRLFKIQQERS
jgi:hypothetical protein